jgi:pimeloyl-ACP methyl ester carboxylesterase
MRAEYIRLYGLFVENKSPEEIMREHPASAAAFFRYPMRVEYFQQVAGIDIRSLWAHTDAYVLAMHGASDFVSSGPEHALIAELVNRRHPGKATYVEIPNADHWELFTESEAVSHAHTATVVNPLSVTTAVRWILEHTKS